MYNFVNTLLHKFFYNSTSIVPAEPEGIGQCCPHFSFLSFIECEIQFMIDFRIIVTFCMIDRGRYDTVFNCHNAKDCLQCSGCT